VTKVLLATGIGAISGLVLSAAIFYAWLAGFPGFDHDIEWT
jgi:hypothetical protein